MTPQEERDEIRRLSEINRFLKRGVRVEQLRLTHDELQLLADRLYGRSRSVISTDSRNERCDLLAASRAIRGLLRHYELATGRQLETVYISGVL